MYEIRLGFDRNNVINDDIVKSELEEFLKPTGKFRCEMEDDAIAFKGRIGNDKIMDVLEKLPDDVRVLRIESKNGVIYEYDQSFVVIDPVTDLDDKIYIKCMKVNDQSERSDCSII